MTPEQKSQLPTNPSTQPLSPEEALRRHQSGDRSPEVLKTLNQAAWEAFHAPWEPPMEGRAMPDDIPEPAQSENGLSPLTEELISAWITQVGYSAFSHPGRGFLITYKFGLRSDRCVQFRLYVSGKDADILVLNWSCDKRVPPDQFVRALRLCNWWNNEYRWPRAMVEQDYRYTDADEDPPPSKEEVEAREATHATHLVLDYQVCLPHGIHQKTLNALIDSAIETSWAFWRRAHEEWGL
jgi:hypothetical protein